MEKDEREKLIARLRATSTRYDPAKGPYKAEDIYQDFDHHRMDEAKENATRRAGSLELIKERGGSDPQQQEQANNIANRYYDQRQQTADSLIDKAESATCKANGIQTVEARSTEQQARDLQRSERDSQTTGNGNNPNRAQFLTDPSLLPRGGGGEGRDESGRGNQGNEGNPGALTPRSIPNRDFIAQHTDGGNPGTNAPHPDPKRKPPKFDGRDGPDL